MDSFYNFFLKTYPEFLLMMDLRSLKSVGVLISLDN